MKSSSINICAKRGYPSIPSYLPKKKRVIAIGDLHGDLDLTLYLLKDIAKVIDNRGEWVAQPKDTVVIQLGDQIDSCRGNCEVPSQNGEDSPHDLVILKYFTYLHKQAAKYGGAVISLLGNHELMNVAGNMSYVSYSNMQLFKNYNGISNALEARRAAFQQGSKWSEYLGCTRVSSIIIGSWIFVHGGFTNTIAEQYSNLDNVNDIVRRWLVEGINDENTELFINSTENSPFWERILGKLPPNLPESNDKCQSMLDPILQIYQVKNIVIGHTPQFIQNKASVNATCGNKLWRVDTGAAKAFKEFEDKHHRIPMVLEILNDTKTKILY